MLVTQYLLSKKYMALFYILCKFLQNLCNQCLQNDRLQYFLILFCCLFSWWNCFIDYFLVFNMASFGTEKKDWVIKKSKIFSFLHLINNYLIMAWNFLFVAISAIMSSKKINFFSNWIVIINILINVIHHIWILNKCIWIIIMRYSCICTFFNEKLILGFI